MPVFTRTTPWDGGDVPAPSVLAIGDSWFWYPKAGNLMNAWDHSPAVKDDYKSIQLFGYNGADIADYVGNGTYADDFSHELSPTQFKDYQVFVLSGGGNDAVDGRSDRAGPAPDPAFGYGARNNDVKNDAARIALGLKDDCTGVTRPEDCIDEDNLDVLLRSISNSVGSLLHDVLWASDRDMRSGARKSPIKILLHCYDYPVPDGRGFGIGSVTLVGPWLSRAMDARHVNADPAFRFKVASVLIQRMHDMFAGYANPARNIYFVDSLGALNSALAGDAYKADWDNEMHPTGDGFTKLFASRWVPVLRQAGLAA
jgi:hypothetical protein